MQFDIKLKSQDMYRFNMYQTYTGFHGWFSIIVSIIIFFVAGLTYGGLDITYTVLYIAFGIIFLLYMPDEFINEEGNGVTEAFKEWCKPLIGGELPKMISFN